MTAHVENAAAPIVAGQGVTLLVSDRPDPVYGVVTHVYIDAAGTEVAEIALPSRPKQPALQATQFLTPWVLPTPWWAEGVSA